MNDLILLSDGTYLFPQNAEVVGSVFCIPGSTMSGFQGFGTLSLTPDALVLATPKGVEDVIPLWGIEDVSVIKLDGVIIERPTSVGSLLSPLPYPHGIEVVYSQETRVRLRIRLATLASNAAHAWAVEIRRATRLVQLDILSQMMPRRHTPGRK